MVVVIARNQKHEKFTHIQERLLKLLEDSRFHNLFPLKAFACL
jgi:hypothetical protein